MTDKVLYVYVDPDLHTAVKAAAKQEGVAISELVAPLLVAHFADSQDYITIGFVSFTPDPAHEVECDDCQTAVGERPAFLAIDSHLRPRRVICGPCREDWIQS